MPAFGICDHVWAYGTTGTLTVATINCCELDFFFITCTVGQKLSGLLKSVTCSPSHITMAPLTCPGCSNNKGFSTRKALNLHQTKCRAYHSYYGNKGSTHRAPKRKAPFDEDETAKRQQVASGSGLQEPEVRLRFPSV